MRDWAHSRRLGTPADEAGYVVLRQPPASKLANLLRIDVLRGKTGLTTQENQRPEIRLETRRFLGRRPEFLAVCRVVEENECEKGKLRLRENRRSIVRTGCRPRTCRGAWSRTPGKRKA